jgi:hypothetical protein
VFSHFVPLDASPGYGIGFSIYYPQQGISVYFTLYAPSGDVLQFMNRLLPRATTVAGALALAAAGLALTAAPAAAQLTGGSSSYGASAPAGLTTAIPQGIAASTGPTQVFRQNVDIAGLLTTGLTLDTASGAAAYARVTNVDAQGGGHAMTLTANQVSSTCNNGSDTASPRRRRTR